jgi:hypothetical protein
MILIHVFCLGQAYKEGYEPVEEEFQVVDGQATDLKITLMRTVSHACQVIDVRAISSAIHCISDGLEERIGVSAGSKFQSL